MSRLQIGDSGLSIEAYYNNNSYELMRTYNTKTHTVLAFLPKSIEKTDFKVF